MDSTAARQLFEAQLRRGEGAGPAVRVERVGRVVREVSTDDDGWAAVVWSDLDESTADREIDEQVAYFAGLGRPFEWKLYDGDEPADLADRLQAKGFRAEGPEALMIADIGEIDLGAEPPAGVRLVEVHDADGMELFTRVGAEAFGRRQDDLARDFLSRLQTEPDSLTIVLAMAGDRPVCGARTEFHPGTGFASLWGGGTVPDWRGRGVYRATVAQRAREGRDRGYRYLRVDAMPASEPILTRLGFVRAGTTTPYESPR
jgi:GNAT superfamily N-acetyltransferase